MHDNTKAPVEYVNWVCNEVKPGVDTLLVNPADWKSPNPLGGKLKGRREQETAPHMRPLQRYDCGWGIQIIKVEGKIKMEGIGVMKDIADNDTALTAELTVLYLDKEGSNLSDKEEGTEENQPCKGTATVLYGEDRRRRETKERKGVPRQCP